jgi:lipoyl(octanoyl) transferase
MNKSVSDPEESVAEPPELPLGRAIDLGLIEYQAAWQLQLRLVDERTADRCPDTLLLCQHPNVITVGRRQQAEQNIRDRRFPVFEVERGGDATFHGPGQLVGYPIVKLRPPPGGGLVGGERDLHRFLRRLEQALIELSGDCGVPCGTQPGATGVWTADAAPPRKLASLGIAVRRWVTFHGFALNVSTDLGSFSAVNPCGFSALVMTSLAACGGQLPGSPLAPLTVDALLDRARQRLGQKLDRRFVWADRAELRPLATAP